MVLSDRALNRALLARQHLLERVDLPPHDLVAHLVGMQAQEPRNPYVAMWSRLDPFDPAVVEQLLLDRRVVRVVCLRGTIHLLTDDDARCLPALTRPVLAKALAARTDLRPHLDGADLDAIVRTATSILTERPSTPAELRAALAERFPDVDPAAAAEAARHLLALVQVPPRGLWSASGGIRLTPVDAWLGGRPGRARTRAGAAELDEVVLRYLAAFGPATPADITTWCRLTGMRAVVDRLRPRLRTFLDERGRELVDLPDAPLPDPDTPASVRFLPEYDNVVLSHADRSRIVRHESTALDLERRGLGGVLVDGFHAGFWTVAGGTLTVELARAIGEAAADEVEAEGRRLLAFLAPGGAAFDVRIVSRPG